MGYLFGSSGRARDLEYGSLNRSLTFWDVSDSPITNDRAKKLGKVAELARGAALLDYDTDKALAKYADGYGQPVGTEQRELPGFIAERPVEPDNYVLRIHEDARFEGVLDGVWALRNICDHKNPHSERTHRSTMWLDQNSKQIWANSSDAFWVGDLFAEVVHQEVFFNQAGYLIDIYRGLRNRGADRIGTPLFHRGVLCFNVSKNGGYVTDGGAIGQMHHVLTYDEAPPGPVLDEPPQAQLGTNIWADCFKYPAGDLAALPLLEEAPEETMDEGEENAVVHHYLGEVLPGSPATDMNEEMISGQPEIPKSPHNAIAAYVKQRKHYSDP